MGFYLPDGGKVRVISTLTVLPELILVDCLGCQGRGELQAPAYLGEMYCRCPVCGGSGKVHVCSVCKQAPQVVNGTERCGCVEVS